jgi:Uma2 family endonuclease
MADTNGTSALKKEGRFTLADWRSWPADERWELIDGLAYGMSPSPRVPHQDAALDLAARLFLFLEGKSCRPFVAPLDVFLDEGSAGESSTVLQPDVLVVCDPSKISDDGIHGAPDFVAEVLSESTAYKDLSAKKAVYERAGVKEYWIINPGTGSVFIYVSDGGSFAPAREIPKGSQVQSSFLKGFSWLCP